MIRAKRMFAAVTASALLAGSAAGPAAAATQQNGLVNVNVGNVNILRNANVGIAANVAANVCGVTVGPVAVLANQVARTGATRTVCTTGGQAVTLTQTA